MFYENASITAKNIAPGVVRKILVAEGKMMVAELQMDAGAEVPVHQHLHEQVTYVVEGCLQVTLNGETRLLKKGDSVYFGPNEPHSVKTLEDSKAIDVFTPQREDFK